MTRSLEVINTSNHDGEGFDILPIPNYSAVIEGAEKFITALQDFVPTSSPARTHVNPGEHKDIQLSSYSKDGITILVVKNTEPFRAVPFYSHNVENGRRKDKQIFPKVRVTFE